MSVKLKLVFSDEKRPYLSDVSSLIYDLELLHDFSLILSTEEYSDYRFYRFWYRNGRPIKEHHKVRVSRIIKESPFTIELVIAGIGALWLLLQVMEKIRNLRLNREKLRQEIEKLKVETEIKRIELEQKVQEKEASGILYSLVKRLEINPMKLSDIEIQLDENEDEKDRVIFT